MGKCLHCLEVFTTKYACKQSKIFKDIVQIILLYSLDPPGVGGVKRVLKTYQMAFLHSL